MTIRVGEHPVTLDDLVRLARQGEMVELAPAARERVVAARTLVERLAAMPEPIYGVNSALGANTGAPLAPDDFAEYQLRAIRARAVGVGPPYDRESVRAMLFARIAGMAQGGSGVSLSVLEGLCEFVNRDIVPVVPVIDVSVDIVVLLYVDELSVTTAPVSVTLLLIVSLLQA